jgi:hypothetical protein
MSYAGRLTERVANGARDAIEAVEGSRVGRKVAAGAAVIGMAVVALLAPQVGGDSKAEAQGSHVGRVTVEEGDVAVTEDADVKLVEDRMDEQIAGMVEKGASEDAARETVEDNASAFFAGGENGKISPEKVEVARGKIFEQRADGVCLVETYDGKVAREFGHIELHEGTSGDEVQGLVADALCPTGEVNDGVNLPQVAQTLAVEKAIKDGADPNDLNLLADLTNEYMDTLRAGSPQEIQALYETARDFIEQLKFSSPSESPDIYRSLFIAADGDVHAVEVDGRDGAMQALAEYEKTNDDGSKVVYQVYWGDCGQIRVFVETAPPVVVEAPPVIDTPPPARAMVPPTAIERPPTPVRWTPETTPEVTTPITTNSVGYTVCIGLNDDGTEILHTANAGTTAEAQALAEAYAAEHGESCELRETTTTTTTVIPPSTIITTTTTTLPPPPTTEPEPTTTTAPDKNPGNANNTDQDNGTYLGGGAVPTTTPTEGANNQNTRPNAEDANEGTDSSSRQGAAVVGLGLGGGAAAARRRRKVRFQLPDGTWTWVESNV